MTTLLSIVIIIASILLVFIVFIQNPKGGGLSSDFGAAQQLGGVQKTNDFVEKSTWTLAALITVFSITLTVMKTPAKAKVVEQTTADQGTSQPGEQAPGK